MSVKGVFFLRDVPTSVSKDNSKILMRIAGAIPHHGERLDKQQNQVIFNSQ